jgi:hypothetical protein
MFDSFPFDSWTEDISAFWTFGPDGSTGTYVLTVLGILLMIASLIGFVWLEHQKVMAQAAALRAAGMPVPGGGMPGTGPSQPPLAGPMTDPGR